MREIIKDYWDYLKDIIIFILGIISKFIYNYVKNKYNNKKSLKEHISTIKFVCKNLFSQNEIKLFKYLINNEKYKFDETGLCTFKYNSDSNKNDEEFNELVTIANKDNKEKHFDICLMNPPYAIGGHLKFLKKTIEISEKVVSIQPVTWLKQGNKYKSNSTYHKYEDGISKHIKDLEIINSEESEKYFNIRTDELGIYTCDANGGYDYNNLFNDSIVDKTVKYILDNKCKFDYNEHDGFRIRIPGMATGHGENGPSLALIYIKDIVFKDGKYNDKWWYEYYSKNQNSKIQEDLPISIKFDSEEEAHNFAKQFNTDFVRYINDFIYINTAVEESRILWMGNAKHPRTGKIGYKSEWTDEDFNKFFKLSDEEIKRYKDFINDFKTKRDKWLLRRE